MATRDTGQPVSGITRRDFLKTAAAATAVAGCGLEFAYDPEKAAAYENSNYYTVTFTTCPYCSASCGQRVVVANGATKPDGTAWVAPEAAHPDTALRGQVVDIYGDFESPINQGGLCAKGAGAKQLVNNPYRIGAWSATDAQLAYNGGSHPVNNVFRAIPETGTYASGVAYKRVGNDRNADGSPVWTAIPLATAFSEIATGLVDARGAVDSNNNSKGVAFLGSSHINNEPNYLYRKTIAMFGTSNVEHQARI